jgi:DNA gyrase subunit A
LISIKIRLNFRRRCRSFCLTDQRQRTARFHLNLEDIVDAIVACIDETSIDLQDLANLVKGPDFQLGGVLIHKSEIDDIYETGAGPLTVKSKLGLKHQQNQIILAPFFLEQTDALLSSIRAETAGREVFEFVQDLQNKRASSASRTAMQTNGAP